MTNHVEQLIRNVIPWAIALPAAAVLLPSLLTGCVSSSVSPDYVGEANTSIKWAEASESPTTTAGDREKLAFLFADRPDYVALVTRDPNDTQLPQLRVMVPPKYPLSSILGKGKALVKVAFVISEDGSVEEVRIFESSDDRYSEPALDAVRAWKFYPGTRAGTPSKFIWIAPVRFAGW